MPGVVPDHARGFGCRSSASVDEHGLVEVIGDWIIGLDPLERGRRLIRCQPLLDSPPV